MSLVSITYGQLAFHRLRRPDGKEMTSKNDHRPVTTYILVKPTCSLKLQNKSE
jgi:hypothetical protein